MKFRKLLLIIMIVISGAAYAQKEDTAKKKKKGPLPLDNTTFTIEVSTNANGKTSKGKPDEISFKGGKLKSDFLNEKNGWSGIPYLVTTDSLDSDEDRYIIFEAELEDKENEESIKIKGTVIADNFEATGVWTKKGKQKAEYIFTGSEKKKKK
jgi:hypothetical protein